MNCLICNRVLRHTLTLQELFSFQRFSDPCICTRCLDTFTKIVSAKRCPGCSRVQKDAKQCGDCLKWFQQYPVEMIAHTAFFQYDEPLKDWLHRYKIQGDIRFAKCFSAELKQYYRQHKGSIFVPLPISASSKTERGFNQCEQLLMEAGIPFKRMLLHQSNGKKQAEKNRVERLSSEQPFVLAAEQWDLSKPIVLFDDLYTTGRTLMHAKELLYSLGIGNVSSLTIGR